MKHILFTIESLTCAGAEKSLVTLLNMIDYSRYSVDLQLFSFGGEFEALLPKEVNLLPPLEYFSFTELSLAESFGKCISREKRKMLRGRLGYSIHLRLGQYSNSQKAVLFWKHTHGCFAQSEKEYDVAIAYAQGTPTFYVADCVRAKKKFAWVNVTYKPTGKFREYVSMAYQKFDAITCVSDSAYEIFQTVFPEHKHRGVIIYDINDGRMMEKLSNQPSAAAKQMREGKTKLLTVGRFAKQKGYDIALEACRILKSRGFEFVWYALGRGELEQTIRTGIEEKGIDDCFVLLGTAANPYPYYKEADIYVHTARFEGFGLAIAEARMLNVPVVTTRFDAVYDQMIDGENGLVVGMTPEAVADGIQRLIEDRALYEHIVAFQKQEKKGNYEEIEKFYALIGEDGVR